MLRKTINEMPVLSGRLIRDSARPRSSAVGVLKNHGFPGGCTQGASVTTLAPTLIEHLDFLHHAAHLRSRTRLGIFSAYSRAAMEGMCSTRGSSCAPRPNTCATATTVKNEVFPPCSRLLRVDAPTPKRRASSAWLAYSGTLCGAPSTWHRADCTWGLLNQPGFS